MKSSEVGGSPHEWAAWVEGSTHDDWQAMQPSEYVSAYNRAALHVINNEFDTEYTVVPGQGIRFEFSPRYQAVLFAIGVLAPPPARVVDVGCGPGHLGLELAQRGYQVVFNDCADSMLYIINGRRYLLRPQHRTNVGAFVPGLAHEVLPGLPDQEVVACQEVLEHVPDYMLKSTCEALVKAAQIGLVVSVPNLAEDSWGPHVRCWTDEMLREHLGPDVDIMRSGGACVAVCRTK